MIRHIFLIIIAFTFLQYSNADEGMWLLPEIHKSVIDSMHKMGFKLNAEEIYSATNPSIKDAIVIFDGGCTGEVVSKNGLVFTNHHCGLNAIQSLSSVKNDYINNGFWAKSKAEELPCKNVTVTFLVKMENITDSIIPFINDSMDENFNKKIIEKIKSRIIDKAKENGKYEAEIKGFYNDNEYYLLVKQVFSDIRLVGTPPNSIGKFGGNTDNWMWPRHTGDFSVFRIYSDSSGNPAQFSINNIPLKPKKYLPITLNGIEKDSFTTIIGYPGRTERYMTSKEIEEIIQSVNLPRIKIRGKRQEIMLEAMKNDPKINIQYYTKYSRSSNYYKFSIGQNKALKYQNIVVTKKNEEDEFIQKINSDSLLNLNYGNCITLIDSAIEDRKTAFLAQQYYYEALFRGIEVFGFVKDLMPLINEIFLEEKSSAKYKTNIDEIIKLKNKFYKDYNANLDKKVAIEMLELVSSDIDNTYKFDELKKIENRYHSNIQKIIKRIYKKSILTDSVRFLKYLQNPSRNKLFNDQLFSLAYSAILKLKFINQELTFDKNLLANGQKKLMQAKLILTNEAIYPDANFTMRLTYGSVKGYSPTDAIKFNYFTTLTGVMEKEDSTITEFIVPKKLKELYLKNDYKPYSNTNQMPVCFITNNDITGGNSGSPVLNNKGELIGLAFDGNWESLAGDFTYNPMLKRTICVDIRYVLFIIDKFAGAGYLLNELDINK